MAIRLNKRMAAQYACCNRHLNDLPIILYTLSEYIPAKERKRNLYLYTKRKCNWILFNPFYIEVTLPYQRLYHVGLRRTYTRAGISPPPNTPLHNIPMFIDEIMLY